MTDFHPGDRVRYIGNQTTALIGAEGTVREVTSPENVNVDWDNDDLMPNGVMPGNIELIAKSQKENAMTAEATTTPEITDLDTFKAKTVEVAMKYAIKNDWCAEVERALGELGLEPPAPPTGYTITVKIKPGDVDNEFRPRGIEDAEALYLCFVRALREGYYGDALKVQSYTVENHTD